ncbi:MULTISPECIES: TauD/TfdA family dioxygenase [unclassified Marinomonas]|uniref:TauD/TfdA family dioxygenase n=1 Tax=unclassified Marinomonas TaxID=196814 RepID=UPI0009EEA634|nr:MULTISPECIES: TauD/TfdA family dioxygenase [unclassified Marinomonas]
MLNTRNKITAFNPYFLVSSKENESIKSHHLAQAQLGLEEQGWALFRGFQHNLDSFNELILHFCQQITFDPAREFTTSMSQKVDAGTQAVGLHIENGNTPFPPSLVAFYSQKSARQGSQTILCDGVSLYEALPKSIQERFDSPIRVTRTLPELLWKAYVRNEHPKLAVGQDVTRQHLEDVLKMVPGQDGALNAKRELDYSLKINPLSKHKGKTAFANALLGPSFNYQKPVYHHADGSLIEQSELDQLAEYAEAHTYELDWENGDMIIIDNTRVMHGRRAIQGNPDERQLVIAMGKSV